MGVKAGFKQTEVGVILEDWEPQPIGALCKLINGRGFKPFEWSRTGLPIIRIQNLNGSDEFNYYSGEYAKKIEVQTGQLLFAWSGSRGTSFGPHIWTGPLGLLNYHTWKVEVDQSKVLGAYFFHSLKKLTSFIEGKAHGAAALVHTQKWEMEGFKVAVPASRVEQEAIAEALSDADALITSLEQLLTKKRHIKQGAMQDLLTGKKRLPGFGGEWVSRKIGDLAPFQRGFDLPTSRLRDGSFPVVYSNGVGNYHSEFMVKGPGIVTGRSGTIGVVSYVKENFWPHNTALWVTSFNGNNPVFIYYLYKSIDLERLSTGSGVPTLNRNDVHDLSLLVTLDKDEQIAIAAILSDMDSEIATLEAKLAKARQIKQGMMQELLTGRIRLI